MKKVLFALPALAFTLLLTFCQKADVQETASVPNSNTEVAERGPCTINFYTTSINQLRVCGITANNTTACNLCNNSASAGVEFLPGYGTFPVNPKTCFSVTNTGTTLTYVIVEGPGGSTGEILLLPGACEDFCIGNNCEVIVI